MRGEEEFPVLPSLAYQYTALRIPNGRSRLMIRAGARV